MNDETLAGVVIGLALATPAELDLKALKVSLALDQLDERLKNRVYGKGVIDIVTTVQKPWHINVLV